MNKEKSFAKELAELINRHSIDAKFETADDILATVAIDALNAYAKAKQTQERRNNPETDDCDCPVCQMRRALEAKKAARNPAKRNTGNRRRSTFQRKCKQWRNFSAKCSPEQRLKYTGSKCHGATHGINAGERTNATGKEVTNEPTHNCKNRRRD